jgi:hypothetical protein
MKKMKNYWEFISESVDANHLINRLETNHSRSPYVKEWVKTVNDLLSGKVDEVPRRSFRKPMGDQFGLEFVDDLVKAGILKAYKKGRMMYISAGEDGDKDLSKELDMFREEFNKGVFKWDPATKTATLEYNVTDRLSDYEMREDGYIKDFSNKLEEILSKYCDSVEVDLKSLDYKDASKANRYLSKDFVVRYNLTIKCK